MALAPSKIVDDAATAATRLLEQTYGSLDRVGSVDPIAIAQSLGLRVFDAKLPADMAGILVKRAGNPPEIHLNAADLLVRQRFTCAHEIGHYIQNADTDDGTINRVDYRDDLATRGTDPDEIYANAFAAQLLMPHQVVRRAWADHGSRAADLAARFGVSLEAMKLRVSNLHLR